MKSLQNGVPGGAWLVSTVVLSLVLLVTSACSSHVVVHSVNDQAKTGQKFDNEGVYFALPQTQILVQGTLNKTQKKAGTHAGWSKLLIGTEPAVKADDAGTAFAFKPFPTVTTRGVPDPDAMFFVEVEGSWVQDRIFDLKLTEAGTLTQGKGTVDDTTVDLVVSVLSTAAAVAAIPSPGIVALASGTVLASDGFSPQGAPGGEGDLQELGEARFEFVWHESEQDPTRFQQRFNVPAEVFRQYFEAELQAQDPCAALTAVYPTATVAQCDLFVQLGEQEQEEWVTLIKTQGVRDFVQAWIVREQIRQLQERRAKLTTRAIRADTPFLEGQNLETRLDKLDAQIDGLLRKHFLGSKKTTPWNFSIPWIPKVDALDDSSETKNVLTLKKGYGVCDADDVLLDLRVPAAMVARAPKCKDGDPDCQELQDFNEAKCLPLTLKVERQADVYLANVQKTAPSIDPNEQLGFRYRIPAEAAVSLDFDAKPLARHDVLVAQYGAIVALPTSTGGRYTSYDLSLHPTTGALATFVLNSDPAVSKANLDALGQALVDSEKAKASEDDQLEKLKRERDILEAYQKIEEIREKLDEP